MSYFLNVTDLNQDIKSLFKDFEKSRPLDREKTEEIKIRFLKLWNADIEKKHVTKNTFIMLIKINAVIRAIPYHSLANQIKINEYTIF